MDPRDLLERYYREAWVDGNADVLDELLADDYVDRTPPPGFDGSRETQKQVVAFMRDSSTDKRLDLHVLDPRRRAAHDHAGRGLLPTPGWGDRGDLAR